jgi:hypothetical protein
MKGIRYIHERRRTPKGICHFAALRSPNASAFQVTFTSIVYDGLHYEIQFF